MERSGIEPEVLMECTKCKKAFMTPRVSMYMGNIERVCPECKEVNNDSKGDKDNKKVPKKNGRVTSTRQRKGSD